MSKPDFGNTDYLDKTIQELLECKPLAEGRIKALCEKAKEILVTEKNLVPVHAPVTICGDIHG